MQSVTALSTRRRPIFRQLQRQWATDISSSSTGSPPRHLASVSAFPFKHWTKEHDFIIKGRNNNNLSPGSAPIRFYPPSLRSACGPHRFLSTATSDRHENTMEATTNSVAERFNKTESSTTDGVGSSLVETTPEVASSADSRNNDKASDGKKNKKKSRSHRRSRGNRRQLIESQMKRIKVLQIEPELHSTSTIENDFEFLAQHMGLMKIKWMERIYKELQKELKAMRQGQPAEERAGMYEKEETDPQRRLWKKVLELFTKNKIPMEMKDVFLHRLVVQSSTNTKELEPPSEERQQQIERDIALLQQARSVAVQHPMFWSRDWKRKVRKTLKKRKVATSMLEDATTLATTLDDTDLTSHSTTEVYTDRVRRPALEALHQNLSETQQYHEAAAFQTRIQRYLSEQQYGSLMQYIQDYINSCNEVASAPGKASGDENDGEDVEGYENQESFIAMDKEIEDIVDIETAVMFPDIVEPLTDGHSIGEEQSKITQQQLHNQQELRIVKSNLLKFIPDNRFNLVAQDVSEFLYVTASDEIIDKTLGVQQLKDTVYKDRIVLASQTRWDAAKELYTKCFQQVHKILLKVKTEEFPPIIQNETIGNNGPTEDSVLETIAAVAATKPKDEKPGTSTERMRPRNYIAFEAMDIAQPALQKENDDRDTNRKFDLLSGINMSSENQKQIFRSEAFPAKAPTERMVFIDNLPIDINRDRLLKAYGRTGEIEALEIFHHRPELDPGRKAIDERKKIRNASSSSRRQKWIRPRTPLYGMLLYKEPEAAAKAVADPLRIFGMVLDKHLIRSHRASDMTKLYLEDVNPKHDITSIEYDLSRILHPNLYVCLDVSAHRRRRRKRGPPEALSGVIQFPSFEAAYWAYQKLYLDLEYLQHEDSGCSLHWTDTPADAMLYWTRQLNF